MDAAATALLTATNTAGFFVATPITGFASFAPRLNPVIVE